MPASRSRAKRPFLSSTSLALKKIIFNDIFLGFFTRCPLLLLIPVGLHDAVRAQWHFRKVESEVMVVVADEGIEGINAVMAWCSAKGVNLGYTPARRRPRAAA